MGLFQSLVSRTEDLLENAERALHHLTELSKSVKSEILHNRITKHSANVMSSSISKSLKYLQSVHQALQIAGGRVDTGQQSLDQ